MLDSSDSDTTTQTQSDNNSDTQDNPAAVGSSFMNSNNSQSNDPVTTPSNNQPPMQSPPMDTTPAADNPTLEFTTDAGSDDGDQKSKKAIATILGVVLLVAGVAAGVLLVNRNSEVRIKAWDCVNYVFEVSEDGVVSVRNGSTRNEPLQKAQVKINGTVVATLDVPSLEAGNAATLGTVPVPTGDFSWEVIGTKDCDNSGSYGSTSPTPTSSQVQAQCNEVVAYDDSWNVLSTDDLSQLEEGDTVRFTISGTATSGSFEKARFTINGTLRTEVTEQRPGSTDYYDEYTIPADETSFNVSAEIFHSEFGWL